ncbi:MAG: NlpC/P60 family protein [Propionibacteriaceae bacterium]|nr:NlpC/P60 family protein [Propionibacteriaceae bacterium]
MKKSAVALFATLLTASVVWMGQPSSQADDLTDAQAQLVTLQGEASQADEQYNQVQASLTAAQTKLTQTQDDIASQQSKVEALRQQVAIVSLQQFQDRGITSTTALFTAANQDEALNRIIMSTMVADTTTALLQNYQLSQATLADLQREQQATVDSIAADEQKALDLKSQASLKVQQAQSLVDRLTAAQQAALLGNAAGLANGPNKNANYAPPPPVQNGPAAAAIVAWAMARVGLPYVYGGAGPNSYDCSGFTMAAFATVGIRLPHGAGGQFNLGTPVAKADLQPGDLVFFYSGPGHVGIYVGGGMIVDARNERVGVVYSSIDVGMPFVGARRYL